jgi:hypothetical protein
MTKTPAVPPASADTQKNESIKLPGGTWYGTTPLFRVSRDTVITSIPHVFLDDVANDPDER